ncbi:MAG: hypothetical protein ACRETU_00675 [Steroidobacterales bacterium]
MDREIPTFRIWSLALLTVLGLGAFQAQAEPVKLPAGMRVVLELQHHVTSGYVPTGSPIYFRVAKDVQIGGVTLIRQGTLVTGKMELASSRGMVGHSGSMSLGVRTVKAVDGTEVPVEADLSKQGRSRTGATVAWTLFWGIPGLVTKGVNPYLERGTNVEADVTTETAIDPALEPPPAAAAEQSQSTVLPFTVKNFKFLNGTTDKLKFDIERSKDLKTVTFQTTLPAEVTDPLAILSTQGLVAVDGVPVPYEIRAKSATPKSMTFDGWTITQFCRDGVTELKFRGQAPCGQILESVYQMHVKVAKKG